MKVFSTRSCEHLLKNMNVDCGAVTIKTFSDGEIYVRIDEDVINKEVWVLASTPPPGDHIVELLLLLDALECNGAQVNLLLTYFGYARQDKPQPGEAFSAAVLLKIFYPFSFNQIKIVHIHNQRLRRFLDFQDLILLDFFLPLAQKADCIVAPDEGAHAVAQQIAKATDKSCVVLHKKRPAPEQVEIAANDNDIYDKSVLIVDDMIATGGTIVNAAQHLHERGAREIVVAATHGIFSGDAFDMIKQSPISNIYVTNSLLQNTDHEKITIIDIAPMLEPFIIAR